MRVSRAWLSDYIDLPTEDPAKLAHAFDMLGETVESVDHHDIGWTGVRIGAVDTVAAHPDADRIRVCTVSSGEGPITVVCGAWNFEAGDVVAFAPPGAVLPDGLEIGVRTIRGVESYGMICSERELGLGDDQEGILVLEPDAPVGQPLETALELPDVVFELEVTPNRPDAMSMVGIARELAAWFDIGFRTPAPTPETSPGGIGISVVIEDADGNPRFVARRVDGVTVGPSPLWMRHRLRKAGVRPISNLVDITNYVMLELGQPLHVFDADRITGDRLVVRRAVEGEHLTTLDGVERNLTGQDLVICDGDGPTSLAGTMGGEESEVHQGTTSALIEAASWHPPTIMHMSRRHGLRSEASARFERGVDPQLPPLASLRAAELVTDLAGGALRAEHVDEVARPAQPRTITLPVAEVIRLLGDRFDSATTTALLRRLGFEVDGADPLSVLVPTYRPDVARPVDLVEEVARLADYDTFEGRLRMGSAGGLVPSQRWSRRLRRFLVSRGYSQAFTLSFITPEEVDAFGASQGHELCDVVEVQNPLSAAEALLRTSMLPGLLRVVRHNRGRGRQDVAVFEQGRVFHHRPWDTDPRVPDQPDRIGIVAAGRTDATSLDGSGRDADIHTMTGLLAALADALGLHVTVEPGSYPGFHPGRTGAVRAAGVVIGHVGELHPVTAAAFELTGRVAVAEFDIDTLLESRRDPVYRPVSPYPPVDFDLSFEVGSATPASSVAQTVSDSGGDVVESVRIFDEFTGAGLPAGYKAVAMRVRLRAADHTLDAAEIASVRRDMVAAADVAGAVLRGSA